MYDVKKQQEQASRHWEQFNDNNMPAYSTESTTIYTTDSHTISGGPEDIFLRLNLDLQRLRQTEDKAVNVQTQSVINAYLTSTA